MRRHLDLFSGIGGFALAARWAGIDTVGFCEIEEFPRKVLKKNFPGVPIHDDIRTLKNDGQYGTVDIITGGFPCQPFSVAGQRKGTEDNRDLWPEMFRIIKEFRPTWVVSENVTGFVEMALDRTAIDLENEGYDVQPLVIPAMSVGAPHRRDRVWIIANANAKRFSRGESPRYEKEGWKKKQSQGCIERTVWREWKNGIPSPRICRANDGVPNRTHRLKGLGNAIVPQVAYEIFKAIP